MYSTCLSCHAPLGANEVLEHFPVGRRVAFDQARGRLWAVCPVCRQWNLAALDERWEAIEQAERLFRGTRLRASTDQVGLARMADGTELVRIGEPQRPEFAAWRYGARFTKRWLLRGPVTAVGAGAAIAFKKIPIWLLVQFGSVLAAPALLAGGTLGAAHLVRTRRHVQRITLPGGRFASLTQAHIDAMRVARVAGGGWRLDVKHGPERGEPRRFDAFDPVTSFEGAEAMRVAARLLPRVNRTGGRRATVEEAVQLLEQAKDPDGVFRMLSTRGGGEGARAG
jgi:hypothetical protein